MKNVDNAVRLYYVGKYKIKPNDYIFCKNAEFSRSPILQGENDAGK